MVWRLQRFKEYIGNILTGWPLSGQREIPRQFSAWSENKMKCTSSAKSRMDANIQQTINSFMPLFPGKIFPWQIVLGAVFPHFCPDKLDIWYGKRLSGTMCRPYRAKNPFLDKWVNAIPARLRCTARRPAGNKWWQAQQTSPVPNCRVVPPGESHLGVSLHGGPTWWMWSASYCRVLPPGEFNGTANGCVFWKFHGRQRDYLGTFYSLLEVN